MKMLLTVEFPLEPFNSLVRNGKVGEVIGRVLETIKPEMAYFTEQDGKRGGIFVVNIQTSIGCAIVFRAVLSQLSGQL